MLHAAVEFAFFLFYLLRSFVNHKDFAARPIAVWSMKHFESLGIPGLARAYHSRPAAIWPGPIMLLRGVVREDDWNAYVEHLALCGRPKPEVIWVSGENLIEGIRRSSHLRARLRAEAYFGRKLCFYLGSGLEAGLLRVLKLDWSNTLNVPYHPVFGNKPALRRWAHQVGLGESMPQGLVFRPDNSLDPVVHALTLVQLFAKTCKSTELVLKIEGGEGGAGCTGGFNPFEFCGEDAVSTFRALAGGIIDQAVREGKLLLLEEWLSHNDWLDCSVMFDGGNIVYETIQLLDPVHNKDHEGNIVASGTPILSTGASSALREAAVKLVSLASNYVDQDGTPRPLTGCYGIDALYNPQTGMVRILEVNPRWSASRIPHQLAEALREEFGRPTCVIMDNISGVERDLAHVLQKVADVALTNGVGSVITCPLGAVDCGKITVLTAGTSLADAEERHDDLRVLLGKPKRFSGGRGSGKHRAIAA